MKEEGFIIPYTYHCMAMSCFADVLEEELGNDWRWAQLLPKHFDVCDPKGTPMFHKGIHMPCYCAPNIWPVLSGHGTEDDARRIKIILLFAKKPRNKGSFLAGFIEVKEVRIFKIGAEISPPSCISCPEFVAGKCRKRGKKAKDWGMKIIYESVHIINPEGAKIKNPINTRCAVWEREEKSKKPECRSVREIQGELLKIYREARKHAENGIPREKWRSWISDMASALHKHGVLQYLYNRERIRKVWRFAGVLKIVEDTLRGAGRSI